MKYRRWLTAAVTVLTIALAVAWLSGWFESKIAPGETESVARPLPVGARVLPVTAETEAAVEWASGAVASARQATVAARILARVEKVTVGAGDHVEVNDLLVALDARDLQARAQQAREALKAGTAEYEFARRELERADALLKRGVGTRQRYDQALSAMKSAEAEFERLNQARREAETALSYTEIQAPVSGRVVDRLVEPGDTVSPGQPLLRIYDPTVLRVEAPVRESLAIALTVGARLRVEVAALGKSMQGEIEEIVPYAEPGARTLLVKVRLPADARLFAGLFARLAIPAGERRHLLVPALAVRRVGQLEFATVVDNNRPERRMVTTGILMNDGRIEILSGLAEGELVLVESASE